MRTRSRSQGLVRIDTVAVGFPPLFGYDVTLSRKLTGARIQRKGPSEGVGGK